jgi:hypothetical protein
VDEVRPTALLVAAGPPGGSAAGGSHHPCILGNVAMRPTIGVCIMFLVLGFALGVWVATP